MLSRESQNTYLGVVTLGNVKSLKLNCLNSSQINNDIVIVNYNELVDVSDDAIEITDPILYSALPIGIDSNEYPVLFVQQGLYLSNFIEDRLLSLELFSRLVEKGKKISKNSTKLITLQSLREILKKTFSNSIEKGSWNDLSDELIAYIKELINRYPYLGYLPVAERLEFRKKNTADASFAWAIYFKYFIEQWKKSNANISIPNMDKQFTFQGWTGNFFDRENPLWSNYVGKNGRFQFNDAQRELIYNLWKHWITT